MPARHPCCYCPTMNVSRFRRVLQAVLLSAGPCATIACSSAGETEMPERAQCVDLNATTRYSALTLAPAVDGIAFATRTGPRNAMAIAPVPALRLPALGAPCAGATDREACAARIETLFADPSSEGWNVDDGSCQSFRGCQRANTHDLAAVTTRLARRFGATPPTPRVEITATKPEPSLLQLARENAVEGCVREA